MKCEYCDSQIAQLPENGICPNCGARLPAQAPPTWSQRLDPAPPPVYRPAVPLTPGVNCCGRCMSPAITWKKRGFSWGWGIFWFFILPVFGLFLGFVGADRRIYRCSACGHTWKQR